jgi:hypothetical protein
MEPDRRRVPRWAGQRKIKTQTKTRDINDASCVGSIQSKLIEGTDKFMVEIHSGHKSAA